MKLRRGQKAESESIVTQCFHSMQNKPKWEDAKTARTRAWQGIQGREKSTSQRRVLGQHSAARMKCVQAYPCAFVMA
jgi:hypothetical protein